MLVLPIASGGTQFMLIVLEKENLERMKQGDPVDIQIWRYLPSAPTLVIAYEEDIPKLGEFAQKKDFVGLLEYVQRGKKILPGDLEEPKKWNPNG